MRARMISTKNLLLRVTFPNFGKVRAGLTAAALVSISALALTACNKKDLPPEQALQQRGQTLYTLHCASCHNPGDPKRDGGIGPAVAGSSLELLEARVLRGEYPAGYTPKRATRIMPRLPVAPEDVKALHAYLSSL
jgi:mono/diheme cytochrome c family protein